MLSVLLERVGLDISIIHVSAKVDLIATTVRVGFDLDAVDLGVRRAGLDRTPGWVPGLGRIIELEFESPYSSISRTRRPPPDTISNFGPA